MSSTIVTSSPRSLRFSAVSSPMKPAPTTTARFAPAFTLARMPSMSGIVQRRVTRGSSAPGGDSMIGEEPVAITSLS